MWLKLTPGAPLDPLESFARVQIYRRSSGQHVGSPRPLGDG